MTSRQNERIARLPKWAQSHIARLEAEIRTLKAEREPVRPTAVCSDPSAGMRDRRPVYVDPSRPVRFALDGGDAAESQNFVDVALRVGRLAVSGWGALKVSPAASNRVFIGLEDYGEDEA